MTILALAARNVVRQGRRSLLLGGAVAFGMLVISLAGALTAGFHEAALDNLSLGLGGHVRVSGFIASASGRWQNRMATPSEAILDGLRAEIPGLDMVSFQASTQATLVYGSREVRLPLLGVEERGTPLFQRGLTLQTGTWESWKDARSLIVDSATFQRLGAGLGDEVLVRLVTASGQQNLTEYHLAAVFDVGQAGGRSGALASFQDLKEDLNLRPDEVPSVMFTLKNLDQAPEVAQVLGRNSKGWAAKIEVLTVQQSMGQLATILTTIQWLGWAVFGAMLALISGGVTNTFRMVLLERFKEIGTLRCLGMQKQGVLWLFLTEAFLVCLGGGLAGLALSLPVGALLAALPPGWAGASALVLQQGHLPIKPDVASMVLALGAVALVGLGAASGPARKAAALKPAQALTALS